MEEIQSPHHEHIMHLLMKGRDDAQMSYNQHYKRVITPFVRYLSDQMEEHGISSPIEMAVMMIQQAENEDNSDVLIMNIMAGAMELIEPSE